MQSWCSLDTAGNNRRHCGSVCVETGTLLGRSTVILRPGWRNFEQFCDSFRTAWSTKARLGQFWNGSGQLGQEARLLPKVSSVLVRGVETPAHSCFILGRGFRMGWHCASVVPCNLAVGFLLFQSPLNVRTHTYSHTHVHIFQSDPATWCFTKCCVFIKLCKIRFWWLSSATVGQSWMMKITLSAEKN